MSDLTPFAFDGQSVRVITDEQGDPWFVGTDVTRVLGYRNPSDAIGVLDGDERRTATLALSEGSREVTRDRTLITEAGVYTLTFGSSLPSAKAFRRWITHEVLPAIRQTGSYAAPALTGPQLMAAALIEAQATMAQQTERLAIAAPKAEAFDAFLSTSGDYSVNEAAKVLSRHHDILTGERRLRGWMEANGWIYREGGRPRAYQRRLDQRVLDERAQWHYHPETGEKVLDTPQVRVTARGIEALAKALLKVADQGELEVGA